ncbi:fimbria/pilus outer membrane usher protein [Serratia sp. PL7]|uniref:fimbria/pilus outer membrane usher protein n=1 Tax=Serratia sp. PL7 TaxID=2952201 RepID=UPI0019F1AB51|nr:fimbria/pilus outer membrane usher protein [Serratia sp. PL7]MBE0153099.1 fimbrial biogenesis outer membrane usher protein [Serratia fonticola]
MDQINEENTRNLASKVALVLLLANVTLVGSAWGADASVIPQDSSKGQAYLYNTSFLVGSEKVDIARFAYGNDITPGSYSMSILVNKKLVGKANLLIKDIENKKVVCLSKELIRLLDLKVENAPLDSDPGSCVLLNSLIPTASYIINMPDLAVDFSIPQVYLQRESQGDVSQALWDAGINAGFINYNANYYESRINGNQQALTNSNFFTLLNSGVNLGLWQLRNNSNYSSSNNGISKWTTLNSYLQRPLPAFKGMLVAGEYNTSGQYFDSLSFRGIQLASDDRMLPASQQGFAPVVRGVARTNALVQVSQRGVLLNKTTVAPGAFAIDDLYPTGYGGELDVVVTETDGTVQTFSIPYSSVASLLRDNSSRYAVTFGQLNNQILRSKPTFLQALYSRGISNNVTAYAGSQFAENYQSAVVGSAFNTRLGALGVDITGSSADLPSGNSRGWSVKASHSKYLEISQTFLSLATYRYSDKGYYGFNEAAQQRELDYSHVLRQKGRFELAISQQVLDYGSLFISGSILSYWDRPGSSSNYQAGYSFLVKNINVGTSISRVSNNSGENENQYMLTLSIPFGSERYGYHSVNTSLNTNSEGLSQTTLGLNGSLGQDNSLSYGMSGSTDSHNQSSVSGNMAKNHSMGQASVSASQGRNFRQYALGMSGSAVVHSGGLTLGQYAADSMALVEAKDAAGARVENISGVTIDRFGYAIVPYLSAYRNNTINIDPQGMSENTELLSSGSKVVPYSGAIVKVKFDTRSGNKAFIESTTPDGEPLPMGAMVVDEKGNNVGMVGQGGVLYASGLNDDGLLLVSWRSDLTGQCRIRYHFAKEKTTDKTHGMRQLSLPCTPMK